MFIPVSLGVRRSPDTSGASPSGRAPAKARVDKALSRDSFSCRCCGFQSKKYQRVLFEADLDSEAKGDALVTVCTFCEMTALLDRAASGSGGHLIWLPELSQGELNNVMHALYVARESDDATLAKAAKRTIDVLVARRAEAKKRLGTDDPALLATALHEQLDDKAYRARAQKLEGVRFLAPDRYLVRQRGKDVNLFPAMLTYWASPEGPYGKLPVSEWTKLFGDVSSKATAEERPQPSP